MKPIRVFSEGKALPSSTVVSTKPTKKEIEFESAIRDLEKVVKKYANGKKDAEDLLERTKKLKKNEPKKNQ